MKAERKPGQKLFIFLERSQTYKERDTNGDEQAVEQDREKK